MLRSFLLAGVLVGATSLSSAASTKTIDFEAYSTGTVLNSVNLGGVRLIAQDSAISVTSPSLTYGNVIEKAPSTEDRPFKAKFLSEGVRSVSIDLGTEITGTKLVLKAIGMDGTRIGKTTIKIGKDGLVGMVTLALETSEDIKRIRFGGKHGVESVYADNLTFTNENVVQTPLPAGAVFLITALAGLGFVTRRRKSA